MHMYVQTVGASPHRLNSRNALTQTSPRRQCAELPPVDARHHRLQTATASHVANSATARHHKTGARQSRTYAKSWTS